MLFLLVILTVFTVAGIWIFRAANESRRVHARYDNYARKLLEQNFQLNSCPVKEEYRTLIPRKALGLFKVAGTMLKGDKFAWINLSNSTVGVVMKLHTFFFRPDPAYNLPMLSIDVIFIGSKRIFVIEIIDPAQISDETVRDVLKLSTAPIIASHSSARAVYDHPRNLPDDLIAAVAEAGGVIQATFYYAFLKELESGQYAAVSDFVDHIDHIVSVAGIDHVASAVILTAVRCLVIAVMSARSEISRLSW